MGILLALIFPMWYYKLQQTYWYHQSNGIQIKMIALKLFDHIFYQNNEYATAYQQFCSKQGSELWQLDCQNKNKKNQKYNIVCTYTAYFLGTPLQLLINADIHPSIHPFSSAYLIQSHSSNFMHEVQTRFRLGKQNDLVKKGHVWVFWESILGFSH